MLINAKKMLIAALVYTTLLLLVQGVALADVRPDYSDMSASNRASNLSATAVHGSSDNVSAQPSAVARSASETTPEPQQWRPGVRGPKRSYQEVMPPGILPCSGRDMLYRVHVDSPYATYDSGRLAVKVVDGSAVRDLSEVCLRLPEDADSQGNEISRIIVPKGDKWRFLGNPGAIVWYAPQVNADGAAAPIWAGLGAFDPTHEWKQPKNVDRDLVGLNLVKVTTPSGENLTPEKHEGKEHLNIFTTEINGDPGYKLISTNMGIWKYQAGLGSHSHSNWTFSAPGYWKLYWQAEMSVNGEKQLSEPTEQIWAVGTNLNVMIRNKQMEGTNKVTRNVEEIRKERGIEPPEEDGFDYFGDTEEVQAYNPGDSLDTLTPPEKPDLPERLEDPDTDYLAGIYNDVDFTFSQWDKRKEFIANSYDIVGFNDGPTIVGEDNNVTRMRMFTEKTTKEQKMQAMAPMIASELNGYWPTEPTVENTYRPGERDKLIPVPDKYLIAYDSSTFKNAGRFKEKVKDGQIYAFDQRDPESPKFFISLPADEDNLIKEATVYISDSYNSVAMGTFATDSDTGKDVWTTLAAGVDSNQRAFTLKPGEKKPFSLVFNKPGLAQLSITYKISYKDGVPEPHPAPVQSSFRFLVGSKTVNLWRDLDAKNGFNRTDEREEVVSAPKTAPGFYASYNENMRNYEAKKAELEAARKAEEAKNTENEDVKKAAAEELLRKTEEAVQKAKEIKEQAEAKYRGANEKILHLAQSVEDLKKQKGKNPPPSRYNNTGGSLLPGWNKGDFSVSTPPSADTKDTSEKEIEDSKDTIKIASGNQSEMASKSLNSSFSQHQHPILWMFIGAGIMAALIGLAILIYSFCIARKK